MKKLFIFIFLGIFLLSSVSAVLDIKSFDSEVGRYGEIRIDDYIFFNKIDYRLTDFDASLINVWAEGEYTAHKDSVLFNGLFLRDIKGKTSNLNNVKFYVWANESYEVDVPAKYETVCNDNRTICSERTSTFTKETRYKTYWKEYSLGDKVSEGEGKWRIEGERKLNKKVDFILEAHGKEFTEWEWWDASWGRKKAINYSFSTGSETGYETRVNVTYDSDMQTDFDDLRFTNLAEDTELDYWIETKVDSSWALVWFNATDPINTTNTTVAYMYYGNAGASSASSASATFIFGDDFSTNTTASYTQRSSGGSAVSLKWASSGLSSTGYVYVDESAGGFDKSFFPSSNVSVNSANRVITRVYINTTAVQARAFGGVEGALYRGIVSNTDGLSNAFAFESGTALQNFTVTAGTWYSTALVRNGNVYSSYDAYVGSNTSYSNNLTFSNNLTEAITAPNATMNTRKLVAVVAWDYLLVAKFHGGTETYSFGVEEVAEVITTTLYSPEDDYTSSVDDINFTANITSQNVTVLNTSIYYNNNSLDYLNNDTSLVAYYTLDGNTSDSSAYSGGDGAITGATTNIGQYGGGYNFDSSGGERIRISDAPQYDMDTGNFSISAWIYSTGYSNQGSTFNAVLSRGDLTGSDSPFYGFFIRSDNLLYFIVGDDTNDAWSDSIVTGQWIHAVGTRTNGTIKLYINGVQQTVTDTSNVNLTGTEFFEFGWDGSGSRYFNGSIDDVRVYNRSLTQTEITNLYNQTKQRQTIELNSATTVQNVTFNLTSIPEGNYSWNVWAGGDGDSGAFIQDWGTYRYFLVDTTSPQINISAPTNGQNFPYLTILDNITLNTTITDDNLDIVWYEYNGTNRTITGALTGVLNTTNLTINNNSIVIVWANDTLGQLNSSTSDWNFTLFDFNNYTYDVNITESSSTTIIGHFQTGASISSAYLQYNNTNESVTINSLGGNIYLLSGTVTSPTVSSDTNITWFFWVNDINSTAFNQTVLNVNLDNCDTFGFPIFNYSLQDEREQTIINNTNSTIETTLILKTLEGENVAEFNEVFNGTFTPSICSEFNLTTSGLRIWEQSRYGSTDFVFEQHNLQNQTMTSLPINTTLLDLASADATTFRISYKSETFLPVEDAVVDIQRKYLGEGVFKSVESPITDANGEASASFDLDAVIYRILIKQNGTTLSTFENPAVACDNILTGDCKIILNERQSIDLINNLDVENDFTWGLTQDNRTITLTYEIPSGTARTINLYVNQSTILGNNTACNQTLFASSGQLQCTIDNTLGDVFASATVNVNGELITSGSTTILEDRSTYFGTDNIVLTFFLVLSLILLMISDPIAVLFGIIMGLMSSGLLLLLNSGTPFGAIPVLTYVIIVVIILIVKISMRKDRGI